MEQGQSREPLKDLESRLRRARSKTTRKVKRSAIDDSATQGWGFAFRIGTEMVSALAVGVGMGWALDRWLETGPWLMVLFFFLGAGAGILNVYRAAGGIGYEPPGAPEDETRGDSDPGP